MLIPIVGRMVMFGYLIGRYAKVSEGKEVEDFDSNFFGDYLKIGLRPVLAVLVMLLVAMPFIFVAMLPMIFAPAFGQENEGLMIGLTLFSYPVSPRSGLMMDFKAGFSKEFVFSFVKKSRLRSYRLLYPRGTDFLSPHDRRVSRAHHRVYVVALILRVAIVNLLSQHYDIYLEGGGKPLPCIPMSQPDSADHFNRRPLRSKRNLKPALSAVLPQDQKTWQFLCLSGHLQMLHPIPRADARIDSFF